MKFEYTGRHIEVTLPMRTHVEEHFERIGHLFEKEDNHAHIIIEVEGGLHCSEIVVKWRNQVLTATTTLADMYQSLSQTVDKIERQALKLKNKIIDKSHKAKRASEVVPNTQEVEPELNSPRIITIENFAAKPMTSSEAVMKLEDDDKHFFVFRDAVSEEISIIYKRDDGNYGLIQP